MISISLPCGRCGARVLSAEQLAGRRDPFLEDWGAEVRQPAVPKPNRTAPDATRRGRRRACGCPSSAGEPRRPRSCANSASRTRTYPLLTQGDDDGDPPRLWLPDATFPGTAFTRSLGDKIAESIGVCADPEAQRAALCAAPVSGTECNTRSTQRTHGRSDPRWLCAFALRHSAPARACEGCSAA